MANIASAKKRARQSEKRRRQNMSDRSTLRSGIKQVTKAIDSGDKKAAEAAYKTAMPLVDKLAGKGLAHKNKAARHKSRLNARIRAL
ncbi:MAG: 30S ribosomal protein S20 [Gammaproteobacteria bacterium]